MPLAGKLGSRAEWTERSFLLRSDDGGDNWEYWSTVAYDPAHIINFGEPWLTLLADGDWCACREPATNRSGKTTCGSPPRTTME